MAGLRARIFVLWAMLLAVLPLLAAGERYFCRTTERVIAECCCGGTREATRPSPDPCAELEPEDCCERLDVAALKAAPALRDDGVVAGPLLALLPAALLDVSAARSRGSVAQWAAPRAPPLRGPPLFLAHCVLLI